MTLIEIVRHADKGWRVAKSDTPLTAMVDANGEPLVFTGDTLADTLAQLVVEELRDNYRPNVADLDQLEDAIAIVEDARSDLSNVIEALEAAKDT